MSAFWGKGLSWVMMVQLAFPVSVGAQSTTVSNGNLPTSVSNPFGAFDVNRVMQNYAGACSAMSTQQSLVSGALSAVSSATQGGGDPLAGVQAGLQGSCPAPAPIKGENFSCTMFSKESGTEKRHSKKDKESVPSGNLEKLIDDPQGGLSEEKLKIMLSRNASAVQAYACQEGRLSALEKELNCIRDAAQSFSQQVTPLMQLYQQNISKMQTDITQLKTEVADREQQEQEVAQRLAGDRESGRKGLIEVRDGIKQLVARMNSDIDGEKGVKTALKDLENQKQMLVKLERGLADKIQTETLVEAKKCFSELADPNFRTEKNGPPATLKAYMLTQYERSFQKGKGSQGSAGQGASLNALLGNRSAGVNDLSRSAANQGQSRKQSLEAFVDALFNARPVDPVTGKKNSDAPIRVDADGFPRLSDSYVSRAREYNDTGLDIASFVSQGLNYCLKIGRREIARRRTRLAKVAPGSNPQQPQLADPESVEGIQQSVESTKLMIKRGREMVQTRASDLLNEYANGGQGGPGFNDAMKALTGLNLPINIAACQAAAPDVQVGCLQDFRRNMNEVMSGTGKASQINMVVPGQNTKNTIQFTCAGLDGCIAALQNVKTNLPKERQKIQQFGKQYVQKGNQNIQQFTVQAKEKMAKVNQQLLQQLGNLNTAFASLGISAKINAKPMRAEELQMDRQSCFSSESASQSSRGGRGGGGDEMCLYQTPKDMNAFLGALDVNGDVFGDATEGLAKKREQIEKEKQEVLETETKIKNAYAQCVEEVKGKAQEKLTEKNKKDEEELRKTKKEIEEIKKQLSPCVDRVHCFGENADPNDHLSQLFETVQSLDPERGESYDNEYAEILVALRGKTNDYCKNGSGTQYFADKTEYSGKCSSDPQLSPEDSDRCNKIKERLDKASATINSCTAVTSALREKIDELDQKSIEIERGKSRRAD